MNKLQLLVVTKSIAGEGVDQYLDRITAAMSRSYQKRRGPDVATQVRSAGEIELFVKEVGTMSLCYGEFSSEIFYRGVKDVLLIDKRYFYPDIVNDIMAAIKKLTYKHAFHHAVELATIKMLFESTGVKKEIRTPDIHYYLFPLTTHLDSTVFSRFAERSFTALSPVS